MGPGVIRVKTDGFYVGGTRRAGIAESEQRISPVLCASGWSGFSGSKPIGVQCFPRAVLLLPQKAQIITWVGVCPDPRGSPGNKIGRFAASSGRLQQDSVVVQRFRILWPEGDSVRVRSHRGFHALLNRESHASD